MAQEGLKRKLAAILSADVAGYSRLMEEDEATTVQTLTAYRKTITSLIQQHRGRVVDSPGDNLLAEFVSVVDAVQCAVETQELLKAKNSELTEDRRMQFRIGINLGDIIEEGNRIYGDGVNIASRIEAMANPGGICISRSVYNEIKKKLVLDYEDLGEHSVKNISEPIRVYRVPLERKAASVKIAAVKKLKLKRWHWTILGAAMVVILVAAALVIQYYILRPAPIEPASVDKMAYPLPDKPSIAVLPFVNMSGDPEQEYFADAISENIITELSRFDHLFVIARQSAFTYKGSTKKTNQISQELGVHYLLSGMAAF
jgi:class 3 adenylate cyclase